MSGAAPPPDEDMLLAAELAFGLLEGDARSAAERRVAADAAFAQAFAWWSEQTLALAAGVHASPPPTAWQAIERRLPANDVAAPPEATRAERRWRAAALAASAAAIVLGVIAVRPAPPVSRPPVAAPAAPRVLVAVLTGTDRSAVVTVSFDGGTDRLATMPAFLDPGTRAAELWVIPADGRPRSLGMVSASAPGAPASRRSARAMLAPGVTLAVSLEPPGGSATGLPTGPVILTGKMIAV